MKVLVTGATGFIGSHLVRRLARDGFKVVAPVRKGSRSAHLAMLPLEITEIDLMDSAQVTRLMSGVEVVCHLASIRGSGWSFDDATVQAINVGVTRNLLAASAAKGVRHFVYVSSVSVFGHPTGGPINEDYPHSPVTRYGRTKCESEKLASEYHGSKELSVTIIRPVITYGPGDTWGMVGKLIGLINSRRYATVGTGGNRVHLIYIDDLIDGLMLALRTPDRDALRTYILAAAEPISINKLVKSIATVLNVKVPRFHVPLGLACFTASLLEISFKLVSVRREPIVTCDKIDIMCRDRCFDIAKAAGELGFSPKIGYDEGIQRTIRWLKEAGGA